MHHRLLARSTTILKKIYSHPFNHQLCLGTLPKETFKFYLEQDALYLLEFAKALEILSKRFGQDTEYSRQFKRLSESMLAEERSIAFKAHKITNSNLLFFSQHQRNQREKIDIIADYGNHLIESASDAPIVEAVASCVPCFFVYQQLGEQMIPKCHPDNPYKSWISSYSSPQFLSSTKSIIMTLNKLMADIPHESREEERIIASFIKSAACELKFFEMANLGRENAENNTPKLMLA